MLQLSKARWVVGLLLVTCLQCANGLLAQTDYVYMVQTNNPKNLYSLAMNSREYRELPNSPYQLDNFDDDIHFFFQSSIAVTDPGPYLFVGRTLPDQIYGFYRHIDGQLEPLPGYPINVPSLSDPEGGEGALIWMKQHPSLPVFYTVHTWDGLLRAWRIQPGGSLEELASSPMQIAGFYTGIQGLDITNDGRYFYLNTFFGQIIRGRLDLRTGEFIDFEEHYQSGVEGRSMLLSEDNRYMYTTVAFSKRIQRYAVFEDRLEPLLPELELDHFTTWLWRHENLIVTGAVHRTKASALLIQEDGSLIHGENSPFFVYSNSIDYAAFSPRGDRVYLSGNTFQHAFEIGPNGRMDWIPHSGFELTGFANGLSVAPEIRGDPYSLSLVVPQPNGSEPYRIVGDPRTPFYLRINDICQGPFETDDQGVFVSDVVFQPDLELEITPYCDDQGAVDRVQTVPTLSELGVVLFVISLMVVALRQQRSNKEIPS